MRALIAISLVVLLAGCEVAGQAADVIARDQAKTVVNGIVATQLPGVDAAPVTDCVIDNASASEILTIASSAAIGATQSTIALVLEIAQRPDTVSCIVASGFGLPAL